MLRLNLSIGVLLSASMLVLPSAAAEEKVWSYSGARQMAMGGVYTATVNDETSLVSNPAGLGRLRDSIVTAVDPEITASFTSTDVITLSTVTKILDLQELLNELKRHRGKHYHLKLQALPSFVTTNFGVGVHARYEYDAEMSADGTELDLKYNNDIAAILAYSLRLFSGIVKIGVAARFVNRTELIGKYPEATTDLSVNQYGSEGFGVAGDAGLTVTAPIALLPTLAIVGRDLGTTSYRLSDGLLNRTQSRPRDTPARYDVGLGLYPILSNGTRMTFAVDLRDAQNFGRSSEDGTTYNVMRSLHVGTEFNLRDILFLRFGANQGYWTTGFELASDSFQLQASTYGEEIGTGSARKEDRRWVAKFSFRY
jgi:hypothetical protein